MNPIATIPDLGRELSDLRERAFGPHPDILDDPAALARLAELEEARADALAACASYEPDDAEATGPDEPANDFTPDGPAPAGSESPPQEDAAATSRWRRLAVSGSGRIWLAVGAAAAVIAGTYGATWLLAPDPDATLAPTGQAQVQIPASVMGELDDVDTSTLQQYESFRGLEPWSAVDDFGNPCLIIIDSSTTSLLEAVCTPGEAALMVDIGAWPTFDFEFTEGLPDGSIIRFHFRGDAVEVFVHRAPPP